ncbi:ABC transporter substrate-binding protein [Chitinibacter sp. GC72]|uniref:substrate-binding periplasmic protein n=1 Tax=Chitinibacter sp. GC72 TaxID=1526917 RepID=UPI0012FBFA7D|nr:transporter substrate-binding domain-containing protein [Chitinibacter sp. GC72]
MWTRLQACLRATRALRLPLILLPLLLATPARAEDLRAYTERFPPFNYQQENQQASGISYELLMLIASKARLRIKTEFLPWPRAVNQNSHDANSILFTTVRTAPRENSYLWVGPVDPCDIALIRLKSRNDIQLDTLADAHPYKVGVPAYGADIEILQRNNFPAEQLEKIPSSGSITRMLYAGRFDLVSGILLSHAYEAKTAGLNPAEMTVAYTLQPGLGCYFAFNPKVRPDFYQRFLHAYQALVQDGTLSRLQAKYLR